jgi:hypothetical protein
MFRGRLANQEGIIRENILRDRITFRSLIQTYHLLDLIGDENESVEWFRQIMFKLAGWVNDKERAREILRRFKEEYDRQREEQERFEREVATGCQEIGKKHQSNEPCNPHVMKKFRRFNM